MRGVDRNLRLLADELDIYDFPGMANNTIMITMRSDNSKINLEQDNNMEYFYNYIETSILKNHETN